MRATDFDYANDVRAAIELRTPKTYRILIRVCLVLLVVGGKGGYVERDGHMVDEADVERRRAFGSGG